MSDEELELDLPETRTDFLRSLTMGVEDAKRQRLAAEKEMVAPGGRLGSGDAFTQILTSVLPVVMGAAIAGRRGGMVGAEAGQVANQGLFEAREKIEKEKQAAAKIKYQEASDAEKAALAKLSSGTEGMFRDDQQEKSREAAAVRSDASLAAIMANADKNRDAAMERLVYGEKGRKERQQIGIENEQSKFKKPGLTPMIDPDTGAPYKKTADEHKSTNQIRDGYLESQVYIDGMYESIVPGKENLQGQIKNFYGLIDAVKRMKGYGAAFSQFEATLAQAGLPQIADMTAEGISRWFKGKARGGEVKNIMDVFVSDLNKSTQQRLASNKETFTPPPARGTFAKMGGRKVMYTGTLGPDLKPKVIAVE